MLHIFIRSGKFLSKIGSRISSSSIPRLRFRLYYLLLFVVWCKAFINDSYVCFFTASYYGQFSSFSILGIVWYKVKNSDHRGKLLTDLDAALSLSHVIFCIGQPVISIYIFNFIDRMLLKNMVVFY